jgi:pimeloyl-ACP methyl ester carboxylesterase
MKLVLLPGLDGTGALFKPFIEALPNEVDTLIISYPPNTRLSYIELTALVISQLPDEKFILLGESFSGYIAHQVALSKPKNLKSVIYIATFLENPRPLLLSLFSRLPGSLVLSLPIPEFIVKKYLFGMAANKNMTDLFRQNIKQVSPHVLSFRLDEIAKLQDSNQLCEIKALYIQATEDKLIPEKCVGNFKNLFNDIKVFQIEGPHFVLQTNPLACIKVLINETTLLETAD